MLVGRQRECRVLLAGKLLKTSHIYRRAVRRLVTVLASALRFVINSGRVHEKGPQDYRGPTRRRAMRSADIRRGHRNRRETTNRSGGATHNASKCNQRRTDEYHRGFIPQSRKRKLNLLHGNSRLVRSSIRCIVRSRCRRRHGTCDERASSENSRTNQPTHDENPRVPRPLHPQRVDARESSSEVPRGRHRFFSMIPRKSIRRRCRRN
jgi:hypothetical protein